MLYHIVFNLAGQEYACAVESQVELSNESSLLDAMEVAYDGVKAEVKKLKEQNPELSKLYPHDIRIYSKEEIVYAFSNFQEGYQI